MHKMLVRPKDASHQQVRDHLHLKIYPNTGKTDDGLAVEKIDVCVRPYIARHKAGEKVFHSEKIHTHYLGKGGDSGFAAGLFEHWM